jgi:hypothetical protein
MKLSVGTASPRCVEVPLALASVNHSAHIEQEKDLDHPDETVDSESREVIRGKVVADDVPIEQTATLAVEPLYLNELPANQSRPSR